MHPLSPALANLATLPLKTGANALFAALGYASSKTEELPSPDAKGFAQAFNHQFTKAAQEGEWQRVELLFQLTGDEVGGRLSLAGDGFDRQRFESFLFFAVELKGDRYSRSALAGMARELNKPFPAPVIVLFRHGQTASLASLHRRENKLHSNRDVLDRVVLLKDIRLQDTHRAHLEILAELGSAKTRARDWQGFLSEWNRVLDLSELNKKFYRKLSNWFFAAKEYAKFPDKSENAVERGLIRLITRLIFTWFVKERGLVPEALFETETIGALLKHSDGDSDSYYRAVLQNLFFATLNSEMNERRFRHASGGVRNQAGDYGLSCYFRYQNEFNDPQAWLDWVRDVPFLNGGLFECLDPEDKDGARIDGFSDEPKRQAHLPNKLFWGPEFNADLSHAYDDKKLKAVKVQPLLNLLHAYKFTIDENTPLEEDVALDPELLGKVFENLLASYNPETRTTARKQTGSFYTPREIVSYMVEEALAAYLSGVAGLTPSSNPALASARLEEGVSPALRLLLSPADNRSAQELGFPEAHIEALVDALQRCTLLDPACGSGAFPMGALAKMVALLGKLDPANNLWRAAQLRAVAERLQAHSQDPDAKAAAQRETQAIFEDNDPDYARKLFLIERCLFGVDIQPIALQIAKLRFFIALIIDQKIMPDKPNFNIRALPNLETKFVAANTLLGLPQTGAITPHDLPPLEAQLAQVRRAHIAPKSRTQKKELEADDKRLRASIETLMHEAGFGDSFITPIVSWNPYDQNAVAPFFDPERMFGPDLKDGFDIVIGNPPYVQVKKGYVSEENFPFSEGKDKGKQNLYKVFVEAAYNFAHKPSEDESGGIVCMITQSSLMCDISARFTREMLLKHTKVFSVIEFPKIAPTKEGQVFEAVLQGTCIVLFRKTAKSDAANIFGISVNNDVTTIERLQWDTLPQGEIFAMYPVGAYIPLVHPGERSILEQMTLGVPRIADLADEVVKGDLNLGTNASSFSPKSTNTKLYRGRHIHRFWLEDEVQEYIKPNFKNDTVKSNAQTVYLVCQNITGTVDEWRLHFCLTKKGEKYLLGDSTNKIKLKDERDVPFVLGVLNSKIMDWFFRKTSTNNHVNNYELEELPIPNATAAEQAAIAQRVEAILAAKAGDVGADVAPLEREIDELVARLYGLDADEKQLVGIG